MATTPKAPTEKNTTTTTTPRSKATINKVETIDQPYETDSNVLQQEATDSAVLGKANAKKRAIESVINRELAEGDIVKVSEHLQALLDGMSPDEVNEVKKLFSNENTTTPRT